MPGLADDTTSIFSAVVEASPDAIITAGMDGIISSWNAAAERITGYRASDVVGQLLTSLIPDEDRDNAMGMLARVHAGETIKSREVTRLRHDGSRIVGLLTLAPIRGADGTIEGSVGILHDITQRKAIEDFLLRNERLASIGFLAAGAAHEINNPIGGIMMAAQYAETALDRPEARDIVEKALTDIQIDAKRCAEIVRRLARVANQERGEPTDSDINEIVEAALRIALRNIDTMSIDVHFEPDDTLPSLTVSRPEIEQALVNLIDSALQANSLSVRISVAVDPQGDGLQIIVADDGSGLPQDVLEHLFDPFFVAKRANGANGLGLSLAQIIVGEHGGSLDVTSSAHDGTTVTVNIPLTP